MPRKERIIIIGCDMNKRKTRKKEIKEKEFKEIKKIIMQYIKRRRRKTHLPESTKNNNLIKKEMSYTFQAIITRTD